MAAEIRCANEGAEKTSDFHVDLLINNTISTILNSYMLLLILLTIHRNTNATPICSEELKNARTAAIL